MTFAQMPRRRIGQTTLDVPIFGYGTAHLGELYSLVPEAQSKATLDAAWTLGVRFYDTAPWYGRGLAEHRLGAFLQAKSRAEFQVSTKVGRTLHRPSNPAIFDRSPWTGGLNFEVRFDYGYDGVMRSYEQALQRLALDTVDALIIHDLDAGIHGDMHATHVNHLISSGIKALEELKKSGDILAFGMGINTNFELETVVPLLPLDFCLVAMPYTLLDQTSLHRGMADLQKRGISAIIGAPFASGILVAGSKGPQNYGYTQAPPEIQAKLRGLEEVCAAHQVALPAAALQFLLAHPIVASVIPGGVRAEEVQQNVTSLTAPIPAGFWSDLKTLNLIDPQAPVPA